MKSSSAYEIALRDVDAELEARGLSLCEDEEPEPLQPTFRGKSAEAQIITDHEWILAGPRETSKTWAALYRLDTLCRTMPKAKAAMLRKIRADMDGTCLETWKTIIAKRPHGAPTVYGGSKPEWYEYPNGARLFIGGFDHPGKTLSGERDWIYVNQAEELALSDWEILVTSCTGRGAVTPTPMLFGDCNPGPPTHWILGRERLVKLHSRHEDNPSLYDDAGNLTPQGVRTIETLDSLTGVRKERLRYGRWAAAEGVVYDGWDRAIHLIERDVLPAFVRRFRVVDFGFTNPFVCQWWGLDNDGRMYLYRELYKSRVIVEDHAVEIKRLSAGESFEATVCDHDAEDRATLERHGVPTQAAYKAVQVGIQAVQARLSKAGDGKPRLYIVRDALVARDEELVAAHKPVCTDQEIEAYAWPKSADGKPVKEEPVKVDDHGMDTMRYAVAYVDHIGGGMWRSWLTSTNSAEKTA